MSGRPTAASTTGSRPAVGVRELRHNLSVYLRRVAAGEAFEVTERSTGISISEALREQRADRL